MFKKFFKSVGSFIKSIPSKVTTLAKNTATAVLGVGYFVIWAPIACICFYVNFFKAFGEICIDLVKCFFAKFKKPVVEAEPTVAEA